MMAMHKWQLLKRHTVLVSQLQFYAFHLVHQITTHLKLFDLVRLNLNRWEFIRRMKFEFSGIKRELAAA